MTISKSIVLSDIQFQANKSELTQKSKIQLDTVVAFLQKNISHCFSIIGYTDASGVEAKNITLSTKRAQKVYDYLIEKKVNNNVLFYSGCGSKNPIATNKYEWGRLKNRRIELLLLKK